jgi:hypothetical protein
MMGNREWEWVAQVSLLRPGGHTEEPQSHNYLSYLLAKGKT